MHKTIACSVLFLAYSWQRKNFEMFSFLFIQDSISEGERDYSEAVTVSLVELLAQAEKLP